MCPCTWFGPVIAEIRLDAVHEYCGLGAVILDGDLVEVGAVMILASTGTADTVSIMLVTDSGMNQ